MTTRYYPAILLLMSSLMTLSDASATELLGSIHGFKFEDFNANGIYEPHQGDSGFPGIAFQLTGLDGFGSLVGPLVVTSDATGQFGYEDLPAGGYFVREMVELLPDFIVPTTNTAVHLIVASGQELVWADGAAELPPGDPRVEIRVGTALMFGNQRVPEPSSFLLAAMVSLLYYSCRRGV